MYQRKMLFLILRLSFEWNDVVEVVLLLSSDSFNSNIRINYSLVSTDFAFPVSFWESVYIEPLLGTGAMKYSRTLITAK